MIVLSLPFPPSVNGYWRNINGRTLISAKGRAYKKAVARLVQWHHAAKNLQGRLTVQVVLHPPDRRKRDIDNSKRLFIYGVILPSLFQAVADAFMVFGGGDDDKERLWENQAKALTLAPFNGLPVIRTMMEGYANAVSGNSFYDDQYTPMMQAFATSKDMAGNSVKWAQGGTQRIDASEYLMRAIWDATQLGGYATGIPVRPVAKVAGGIKDAVTAKTDYPIRRSLGYSPSVVGEK